MIIDDQIKLIYTVCAYLELEPPTIRFNLDTKMVSIFIEIKEPVGVTLSLDMKELEALRRGEYKLILEQMREQYREELKKVTAFLLNGEKTHTDRQIIKHMLNNGNLTISGAAKLYDALERQENQTREEAQPRDIKPDDISAKPSEN